MRLGWEELRVHGLGFRVGSKASMPQPLSRKPQTQDRKSLGFKATRDSVLIMVLVSAQGCAGILMNRHATPLECLSFSLWVGWVAIKEPDLIYHIVGL